MARRFNSIESTADQAEAMVQQGRWVDAERHYRELIGQTHVINYEYDDWLRRLGEIYRHLGRAREAAFVYLYLHYFDMARAQLASDGRGEPSTAPIQDAGALRARLAEIEKKWSDAAQLYQQAGLLVELRGVAPLLLDLGEPGAQRARVLDRRGGRLAAAVAGELGARHVEVVEIEVDERGLAGAAEVAIDLA